MRYLFKKSCSQGQCVNDPSAPTGTCIYGDDYVSSTDLPIQLPYPLMKCNDVINYLIANNQDFVSYCQNANYGFSSSCCQTCASKKKKRTYKIIDLHYD